MVKARLYALGAVLMFASSGLGAAPAHAADVSIPDANLQACIRKALAAAHLPDDLTAANLAGVHVLSCSGSNKVADLTGAEHLVGLEEFYLFGTDVTDLRPIAGLPSLANFQFTTTQAYDLAPVESLPALTVLAVSLPSGTDPAPISNLDGLERLHLGPTGAELPAFEIPPGVWHLGLGGAQLTDLQGLSGGSGVTKLSAFGAKLVSLAGIEGLTNLTELSAGQRSLTDISAVTGLTGLTKLYLNQTGVSDLSPLLALPHLQVLDLSYTGMTDADPLTVLTGLTRLNLAGNRLEDVTPLAGMTSLTSLDLSGNLLSTLSPLSRLPELTTLTADYNQLTDLGADGEWHRLTSASFHHNQLTSIIGLRGAPLRTLDLAMNRISDLRPLAGMAADAAIQLYANRVKDLSPLPDGVDVSAGYQVPEFSQEAGVGTPIPLGIRGVAGDPVCPTFGRTAACADGVVTYPVPGTYVAKVEGRADGLSLTFTQHAGPDGTFTTTYAPKIAKELLLGSSADPYIRDWSPRVDYFTYEWFKDGAAIPGLGQYALSPGATPADLGHRFSVCATGHLDGHVPVRLCSNTGVLVPGIFGYPSYPPLEGLAATGSTLNADPRFWDSGVTLAYQWQKNRKSIRGATAATYRVRASDVGDAIRVRIVGSLPGYRSITVYSHTVRPKKGVFTPARPVVTGLAAVGQELAAASGTWTPSPSHLSYQWYRNGKAISKATKAGYRLTTKDRGTAIKVRVTATRPGYVTKRVYSLPTATVV